MPELALQELPTEISEPRKLAAGQYLAALPPVTQSTALNPDVNNTAETDIEVTGTSQELANIIFLSFRFSQGAEDTQIAMLLDIEHRSHPDLFKGQQYPEVKSRTIKMCTDYYLKDRTHPVTPWDPNEQVFAKAADHASFALNRLFSAFEDRGKRLTNDHNPEFIAKHIILGDLGYLERVGGRAGSPESRGLSTEAYRGDPYSSYFIEYGILRNSTHSPEYQDIFTRAASESTIRQLDPQSLFNLKVMLGIYMENHPAVVDNERIIKLQSLCDEIAPTEERLKELLPPEPESPELSVEEAFRID